MTSVQGRTWLGRAHKGDGSTAERFHVLRSLDLPRWSSFVERQPNASIFHTPEMHRAFGRARGHRPEAWAAVDRAGAVRALLTTVGISTIDGPLGAVTSRTVAFAEPLGDVEAIQALLFAFRRRARRTLFTEVRHVTDAEAGRAALATAGFRHEPHLNFLIDLTVPEADLWRGVASSARRNIQKARRLGVEVEVSSGTEAIDEAYAVMRQVYRRIRVPLPHRTLFDAATTILGPIGRFRLLLARHEGRTIGALTLLRYGDVLTYWYTGTLHEYWSHRPGDLLVARALEEGRALACRTFDFGGAGRPEERYGVRDFKAKYGGRLVDYGRDTWVPSPARLRFATAGYELLRRFL
jgi:serine/alanine adding enzyme